MCGRVSRAAMSTIPVNVDVFVYVVVDVHVLVDVDGFYKNGF